jgi:GlpG protein
MRLIGAVDEEKKAYLFSSFLAKEGIKNNYESYIDPKTNQQRFRIWVEEEEDFDRAVSLFEDFERDPDDPKFQTATDFYSFTPPPIEEKPVGKVKLKIRPKIPRITFSLTNISILVCVLLFFWEGFEALHIQEEKGPIALEIGMTPVLENLLFDYTKEAQAVQKFIAEYPLKGIATVQELPLAAKLQLQKAQSIPSWKGVYDWFEHWNKNDTAYLQNLHLFEKIREGEVWRLFTPCLLHGGLIHILFNMLALWYLGKQMEERIGKMRWLLFAVVAGIIANVFQYLMSGPFFLGFSAILVGMTGFIWIRQKVAPWEGYPLPRMTLLFIFFYIVAMIGLEVFSFFLQITALSNLTPNIGNTAHVTGGIIGILLAKLPFFARRST